MSEEPELGNGVSAIEGANRGVFRMSFTHSRVHVDMDFAVVFGASGTHTTRGAVSMGPASG